MEVEELDKKRVELIQVALHQIMEERREAKVGKHQEDEQGEEESLLLSKLLSKLESLENDAGAAHFPKESSGRETPPSLTPPEAGGVGVDEIVRELRRVRRQNIITHCLLSVMVIVTGFWQFSEVSLLLTVKKKFSNPLQAVGDMITGSFKGWEKKPLVESHPLPPIGVPEPPHMDISSLTLNNHSLPSVFRDP